MSYEEWKRKETLEFMELYNLHSAAVRNCLHCGKAIYYNEDREFCCPEDIIVGFKVWLISLHGTQYWLHGHPECIRHKDLLIIYSCPRLEDIKNAQA